MPGSFGITDGVLTALLLAQVDLVDHTHDDGPDGTGVEVENLAGPVSLVEQEGAVGAIRAPNGQTRARLIEDALLQHLQALEELPADVIVPARLVLSQESAERVRDMVARPPEPTEERLTPTFRFN